MYFPANDIDCCCIPCVNHVRTPLLTQLELTDSSGQTALHLASQDGQIEALSELLERSIDVDARDDQKNTGLHIAAYSRKVCTGYRTGLGTIGQVCSWPASSGAPCCLVVPVKSARPSACFSGWLRVLHLLNNLSEGQDDIWL